MYNTPFGNHVGEPQVAPPRLSTTFEDVWRTQNFTHYFLSIGCENTLARRCVDVTSEKSYRLDVVLRKVVDIDARMNSTTSNVKHQR